ncbi:MAG: hypothetical protein WKG01_38695 [Kofleriaceae bacterium]
MRGRLAVTLLALVATAGGCGSRKRQKRTGDAAPVELIPTPGSGASAGKGPTSEEQEPNEGEDVATPLALGATVVGKVEPESDVDHFRIDVATAGALSIELPAVEGTDLVLELHDAQGALLAKSDRGAAKTREGIPNFGVSPGRYTAVVKAKPDKKAKNKDKRKPAAAPVATPARAHPKGAGSPGGSLAYEITAQVAPFAAANEREPDEDRGTANDLIVGESMSGYVGWGGDVDVWKLSVVALSAKNVLDLEVDAVAGVALTLELVDAIGNTVLTRKAPAGVNLVARRISPVIAAGAPPFHYVTIRGDRSNPEAMYRLTVKEQQAVTDSEVEPNDTLEKPYMIPADRTRVDAAWSAGDVDCFAIAPDPAARTLEISIDTPGEADLSAELHVDGKLVMKSDAPSKGAAEKLTGAVPANGKAVVRIRGTAVAGEGVYELTVAELQPKR